MREFNVVVINETEDIRIDIRNVRAPVLIPEDVDEGALVNLDITGNANTATEFENPPDLTWTEDVLGTTCLRGSEDLTIPMTLKDTGVPGEYTKVKTDYAGRVYEGSKPENIEELGITNVYNKTQVDNLIEASNLPQGGLTGQVVTKQTDTEFDAVWSDPHYIPPGGEGGHSLVKLSNNDYDVTWMEVEGGGGGGVGDFNQFKEYEIGDLCTYQYTIYRCIQAVVPDNVNNPPIVYDPVSAPNKWEKIDGINYNANAYYKVGDLVWFSSSLYKCIQENTGHDPSQFLYWTPYNAVVSKGTTEYVFSSRAEMLACTTFIIGDRVRTLGYAAPDDDGGAIYYIASETESKSKTWALKVDKAKESDPQLYAMINEKKRVTYKMFGAPLNGVDDDGVAMKICHSYADSIYSTDSTGNINQYYCKIENHQGTIYKKNAEPINFCSDIDLSGSTILVDDTNAAWGGIYCWGNADSLIYDFETPDDVKATFTADNFVIAQPSSSSDSLPPNTVLKIEEDPYTARDDSGYLYTVARRELIVHDADGICSTPFSDDWTHAGGEEINCQISDLSGGGYTNSQTFTKYSCSFAYIPNRHGTFVGCDVKINTSANKYCSTVWVKYHNCTIKNFVFRPSATTYHNTAFKNSMIYLWDCYNIRVENIQGFNAAGKKEGSSNGTSGYILRITNCAEVYVEDCRMQGYWGATAMDSVKNVHFKRCHMNRLDIHDYFSNLYAENCTFYNHAIQIGYGRGAASFTNCNFFWNPIANDSYPSAHIVEFNLTYGRVFEGMVYIDNCRVYMKSPADNEFNIFKMEFSPDATSITKHFKIPEITVKNVYIYSDQPSNTHYAYFKVTGSRRATTGKLAPSHVYGLSNDGTVTWEYMGRGINWEGTVNDITVGQVLRIADSFLDEEKKTQFYNRRYYICTQAGRLDWSGTRPTQITDTEFTQGTAKLKYYPSAIWQSKHSYAVGDVIATNPSNFYPLYMFKCKTAGISDGYFPTHTTGTVLEGVNDVVNEPNECWWTYVSTKSSWCTDWYANMSVSDGQRIEAEGRLYLVIKGGTLIEHPPYDTYWFGESDCGTARIQFIGCRWQPKQWYKLNSFCEADGRIYQLAKHDGTTTGKMPTRGNPYCVDGDHIWEYVSSGSGTGTYTGATVNWVANTEFADGAAIKSGASVYIAQPVSTGASQPTDTTINAITMDGERRIQYLGKAQVWVKSKAYAVGDLVYDGNTFVSQCVTAGTSASSGWGPVSDSAWNGSDQVADGTVTWKRLTQTSANGVWRNSSTKYASGTIYLCDIGETAGTVRIYKSLGGLSGSTSPADTSGSEFKNGSLTLSFAGIAGSGGVPAWTANTAYSIGDLVISAGKTYKCVFDGRVTLPNKTIFEDITTNITTGGHVFWFYTGNNVPTRQGDRAWTVILRNCEGVSTTPEGVQTHFGRSGNPAPVYTVT